MKLNEEDKNHTILGSNSLRNKEDYEKLGITLTEIEKDENLVIATLPNGWNKVVRKDEEIDLIDQNNNVRCVSIPINDNKHLFTHLVRKYDVRERRFGSYQQYVEFYFGTDDEEEKLYIAGTVYDGVEYDDKPLCEYDELAPKYIEQCEKYGNENYPNWRDYSAYWDIKEIKKDKQKELTKITNK